MFEILEKGLESKTVAEADLVQLRGQTRTLTLCIVQNGIVENFSNMTIKGMSARVLSKNKSWGFSSTNEANKENVEECLKTTVKLSLASADIDRRELELEPLSVEKVNVSSFAKKPLEVASLEDIKEIPLEAYRGASDVGKEVVNVKASLLGIRDQKWFAGSEGSRIHQDSTRLLLMINTVAKEGLLYCPTSENVGHTGGLEIFDESPPRLIGKAIADRAVMLLKADAPPSGKFRVVLDPTICATLLHEATGHPLEADLAMAGGGFGDQIGKQVLSKLITIYDDGSIQRGLGFLPYDDEGIKSRHTVLVKNGVLQTFMHDRTSAAIAKTTPTGNAHAWDYSVEPLIRQTNIGIELGNHSVEEMVEDIGEGLFIEGTFGGQADANADFTFGFQDATWIRNGKLDKTTRGANLSGNAIQVLKTVDAVSKKAVLRPGACGKSQFAIQGRIVPAIRCEILVGGLGA